MIPPEDTKHANGKRREGVHTIRKRLGAPPPTPDSLARLEGKVGTYSQDIYCCYWQNSNIDKNYANALHSDIFLSLF